MGMKITKPGENEVEKGTLDSEVNYKTEEKQDEELVGYRIIKMLPSGFIPYNTNELYFRGFNIGEIKTLNSNRNNTTSDFFLKVIKDVIKGIEPKEITLIDAKAILVQAMMISVGEVKWTYTSYCPECSYENVKDVTVEDLDFTELKAPKLPVMSDAIKYKGEKVKFDAFRLKHLIESEKFTKKNKQSDIETTMLACISNIRPLQEAYNFFSEMPLAQMTVIKQVNDILFHDINPLHIKCANKSAYVVVDDKTFEAEKARFNGLQKEEVLEGVKIKFGINDIKRQKLLKALEEDDILYTEMPCEEEYIKTLDITLESLTPSDQSRGSNESTISFGEDD